MGSIVDEIIKGRKTFFIAPDKSLFPESYLEEYLSLGYECYFIDTDILLPISTKVDIILSIFKDSIMFFNIDAPIKNDSWTDLISRAQRKYPEALFGVLYAKRQAPGEKERLEKHFLLDMGLQCGCIQLEYQKKNNFGVIEKVLYANQAMGRRKNVRAVCSGSCTVNFTLNKNQQVSAKLNDVSVSHFSITIKQGEQIEIEDYTRITDAQFFVKGYHFRSDAVLYTKRETENGMLYIFAFAGKNGQPGIEGQTKNLLVPKIYSIMIDNCQSLLERLFRTALAQRSKSTPNPVI